MQKTCCFTGHRPEKSLFCEQTEALLFYEAIKNAVSDGYNVFITGMAMGADIIAAEQVLKLKKIYPDIKLICASPFEGCHKRWSSDWRKRYENILSNADEKEFISPHYSAFCFHKRNYWMVDRANRVIASFNGSTGGTKNTIEYAKRKQKEIVILEK